MKLNRLIEYFIPNTSKPLLNKSYRLYVIFITTVGCYGIIFFFFDFALDLRTSSFVNSLVTFVSVISLVLVKKRQFLFSKIIMTVGNTLILSALFMLFKQQTAILGYAMPVLMCSIVIFRGKHLIPGIITGIVNVSILITVISLNYHFPFAYTLSEDQLLQQRLLNFGGITSLSLLITYFIIRVNENIHKAILSQTKIIEQSNSKLKETIKTRDKLFSLIAHDLKGPFQSMSASLEILSAADTTSKDKEMVIEHLSKKAENTIVLLNNLLLWSQHQTETIKFRPESIKLNKVRESMLDIFKLQAAEKDIRIDFLMSDDLLSIYADKNMFECILRNLISNSIKFTAKGGKILIKAKQEGMYVRFEIEDNGVGMDDLVKEMLTNKQSYSSTGTNREVGHGLGMMLIHEFLKFHKSSLEIESEQGKGSKFSFLLNNA